MKIDLCEKVALVTGGSRGIGHAIASALHTAGAKVAVIARDGAGAQAAARRLGASARGYACDVAQGEQVEAGEGNLVGKPDEAGETRHRLQGRRELGGVARGGPLVTGQEG